MERAKTLLCPLTWLLQRTDNQLITARTLQTAPSAAKAQPRQRFVQSPLRECGSKDGHSMKYQGASTSRRLQKAWKPECGDYCHKLISVVGKMSYIAK